jgi:hypothetical protein
METGVHRKHPHWTEEYYDWPGTNIRHAHDQEGPKYVHQQRIHMYEPSRSNNNRSTSINQTSMCLHILGTYIDRTAI